MSSSATTDPVEKTYPAASLLALGLQHVLVMYAGAVAVPLIIGSALHLPKEQIAMLVSADLFCCGIVTIIQSVGILNIGVRLPIMMGISFTAVPTIIAICASRPPESETHRCRSDGLPPRPGSPRGRRRSRPT